MPGLMLHCGANAIDRTALAALPLPEPKGPRHAIRPYINDVELVEQELDQYGLGIVDEAFGVTKDAGRFFGVLECAPIEGELVEREYNLMVGLRGSWDQSISRGLSAGSRIFVCDNLAFSGEVVITTKQTTFVNERIPELLRKAVAKIPAMAEHQQIRFDAYKQTKLTQRQGDAAIMELVRRQIVAPSIVGRIQQEWDEPSHPEHAEYGLSVWRLFNAVTQSLKSPGGEKFTIPALWKQTIPLSDFLDGVGGIH